MVFGDAGSRRRLGVWNEGGCEFLYRSSELQKTVRSSKLETLVVYTCNALIDRSLIY